MPKQGDFAGGWLPIESAPRDGRRLLGATPSGYFVLVQWNETLESFVGSNWIEWNVSNWMPLPEPPK